MPWPGYFLKIACCDVFVIHDNVQITKSGPTRRVKVPNVQQHHLDNKWLTVPLKKHSDFALIKDLKISWDIDWSQKHLNQIKATYHRSPFFKDFFRTLSLWYHQVKEMEYLSDMNIFFITEILSALDIDKEILKSSDLPVEGKATSYNIAITQFLNGTQYISGKGALKYQEDQLFIDHHIQVKQLDAKQKLTHEFPNNNVQVSIIELFMNFEIDAIKNSFKRLVVNG